MPGQAGVGIESAHQQISLVEAPGHGVGEDAGPDVVQQPAITRVEANRGRTSGIRAEAVAENRNPIGLGQPGGRRRILQRIVEFDEAIHSGQGRIAQEPAATHEQPGTSRQDEPPIRGRRQYLSVHHGQEHAIGVERGHPAYGLLRCVIEQTGGATTGAHGKSPISSRLDLHQLIEGRHRAATGEAPGVGRREHEVVTLLLHPGQATGLGGVPGEAGDRWRPGAGSATCPGTGRGGDFHPRGPVRRPDAGRHRAGGSSAPVRGGIVGLLPGPAR